MQLSIIKRKRQREKSIIETIKIGGKLVYR